jgi:hypothetical protein
MILVDSSAWIEYLRDTGSPACGRVDELISTETLIATCDTVVMELLAGLASEREAVTLLRLLDRCQFFPTRPLFDSTGASDIYRACRRAGVTPRAVNDCLIASVAMANGLTILHQDRDFGLIADATGSLEIA